MLYTYSILFPAMDHFEERCEDILRQKREGIAQFPLLEFVLLPKGNPVRDAVTPLTEVLKKYRDRLSPEVPVGVLIQVSLGHGVPPIDDPAPMQRGIGLTDGAVQDFYCPADPALQRYFYDACRAIAQCHPATVMIDDDVRVRSRGAHGGCVCERHMADLARRTGKTWTREELASYLDEHSEDDPVCRAFAQSQTDSLVAFVQAMRDGLDSVDPSIQGAACVNGRGLETGDVAPVIAGKEHPVIMRVPNCDYAPTTVLEFSRLMRRAAAAKQYFSGIADVLLAETDTIPYNRYSKSAAYLHAHYAASLLEGMMGAKHWITRTNCYEPASGEAYRKILAQNAGLYEKLADMGRTLRWEGCRIPIPRKNPLSPTWKEHFSINVLERMGIPFYFSSENGGAVFLNGTLDQCYSDEELETMLRDPTFLASDAAESMIRRGFGDRLGVAIGDPMGPEYNGEDYPDGSRNAPQQKPRKLLPTPGSEIVSTACQYLPTSTVTLSPAVTVYDDSGVQRVTFCGTPEARHNYYEAFSFLTEARKKQLVELLRRCGQLPVYFVGDEQVMVRCARLNDGRRLIMVLNTGIDPIASVPLWTAQPVQEVARLNSDGTEAPVPFTVSNGVLTAELPSVMMDPLFLLLQ